MHDTYDNIPDDLIAKKVDWGENLDDIGYAEGSLHLTNTHRMQYYINRVYDVTAKIILIPLVIASIIGLFFMTDIFPSSDSEYFGLISKISAVVAAILFLLALLPSKEILPMVFDKNEGRFWRGRKKPSQEIKEEDEIGYDFIADIDQIYALQLISFEIDCEEGGTVNQLNLVLKSTQRIRLRNCSFKYSLRKDARILAEFLDVPIWDAIPTSWVDRLFSS